uniref:B1 homeodomain mating type protein n=1 Tax=Heterobasidion occidentale TaxID=942053 RepID=S5RVY2_9AGAM|nr:b1 homeodomain mating type protein [Heterobasidion occidentale]
MPRHRFYTRLERAQDDLLSAVVEGPVALATFQTQWSKLVTDFEEEIRLNQLDDEVMEMAKSTASVVSTITGSFLHLETKGTDIYNELSKGLEDMLDNDGPSAISPTPASPAPFQSHRDLYVWLRRHLHNPYPSATAKANLVQSSGLSSDSVAAWFQNARERIGWTTLARHRFQGRRSAIVDAAWRAFVEPDPHRPLPPNLQHAFSIVKENLANLLSDTSSHKDVDQIRVEGLSPEINDGAEVHDELSGELQRGARKNYRADSEGDLQTTRSPPDSRTLHLLDLDQSEGEEEDMTPPPPIAGCKRRADTDLEACDSSRFPQKIRYRSPKRQRSEPLSTSHQVPSYPVLTLTGTGVQASNVESALPSPIRLTPSFTSMLLNDSFLAASPALPSFSTTQSPSQPFASAPSSRKRRLSDASCDIIPKRPRYIHSGHRMQIVSNPLPLGPNEIAQDSALFESWYQNVTYAASEPFGGDLSSNCSPATSILNTPWTDGLLLPNDFMVPSQQVDLSNEDFKAMLASGYDMSSSFIPVDQGLLETLRSLDGLFPPSLSGLQTPLTEQSAQYIIDLGLQAVSTSQTGECKAQSSFIPSSLSYDDPHQILLPPLEEIVNPISDTLTQCTSLCDIGEDMLDNWTSTTH